MSELNGTSCRKCQRLICGRQVVLNLAMGYLERYLCADCLARENTRETRELVVYLRNYLARRPCFTQEWEKVKDCPAGLSACPHRIYCFGELPSLGG